MTRSDHASDLLDLMMALHHETNQAVLVSDTGDEAKVIWLPKSKIEIEKSGRQIQSVRRGGLQGPMLPVITVTLPEWLAIDKGLV